MAPRAEAASEYCVSCAEGESFVCRSDESVLEAMTRAKAGPVGRGCFGGGCGMCKMRVDLGRYYRFKPMSRAHVTKEEEQAGVVLLCCIQPRSDLVLSAVKDK